MSRAEEVLTDMDEIFGMIPYRHLGRGQRKTNKAAHHAAHIYAKGKAKEEYKTVVAEPKDPRHSRREHKRLARDAAKAKYTVAYNTAFSGTRDILSRNK